MEVTTEEMGTWTQYSELQPWETCLNEAGELLSLHEVIVGSPQDPSSGGFDSSTTPNLTSYSETPASALLEGSSTAFPGTESLVTSIATESSPAPETSQRNMEVTTEEMGTWTQYSELQPWETCLNEAGELLSLHEVIVGSPQDPSSGGFDSSTTPNLTSYSETPASALLEGSSTAFPGTESLVTSIATESSPAPETAQLNMEVTTEEKGTWTQYSELQPWETCLNEAGELLSLHEEVVGSPQDSFSGGFDSSTTPNLPSNSETPASALLEGSSTAFPGTESLVTSIATESSPAPETAQLNTEVTTEEKGTWTQYSELQPWETCLNEAGELLSLHEEVVGSPQDSFSGGFDSSTTPNLTSYSETPASALLEGSSTAFPGTESQVESTKAEPSSAQEPPQQDKEIAAVSPPLPNFVDQAQAINRPYTFRANQGTSRGRGQKRSQTTGTLRETRSSKRILRKRK
ncbi:uncharacterized protein [Hetaerina americana]|uniref:uncharacterized protein n=1 Tax=Hetaerina americana TaxID=62018 RepID=UPI003A7F2AE0